MTSPWESRAILPGLILRSAACCSLSVVIVCFGLATSISAIQSMERADNLYYNHTLVLEENIKNLMVLIPNEAHHGPHPTKESRFIEQPFLPARAVVNVGTTVLWFNGDAGYKHKMSINPAQGQESSSGSVTNAFSTHEASDPVAFDTIGQFNYADTRTYENKFVMRGNITVKKQNHSVTQASPIDTVGVLMVPAHHVHSYMEVLKEKRFIVNSVHKFKNLSGPQKVGDAQSLLVWGTSGMDLSQVLDKLREISLTLPYT